MTPSEPPVVPGLPVPPPGPHGGDGPAVAAALGLDPATVLDLSQSLNPFAPDVPRLAANHLVALRQYPDRGAATRLLATALGVEPERLLLTNGGSEALSLLAAELGGTVVSEPEFALHPRGPEPVRWRSDPHNPLGTLAPAGADADVWDEAYYPLATGRWTAGRRGAVVGSLTKVWACPGLRLGYVLAEPALVSRLARRQPAWPVSTLALALLPDLLAATDLPIWSAGIARARGELVDVLARHGIATDPSDAPWVLAHDPSLRSRLAREGIVVRDCTSFGLPDRVRIAAPDGDGLARLAGALDRTTPDRPGRGRPASARPHPPRNQEPA